jgi:hypothetical protein
MMHNISREDAKTCVGPGWSKLIDKIYDKLPVEVYIMQIKEKWGGLRFYVASATPEVYDVIDAVERESYRTCEVCGKPGKLREDLGWILTLCKEHYNETRLRNQSAYR